MCLLRHKLQQPLVTSSSRILEVCFFVCIVTVFIIKFCLPSVIYVSNCLVICKNSRLPVLCSVPISASGLKSGLDNLLYK